METYSVIIIGFIMIFGIIANIIYFNKIIPTLSKYGHNSSWEGLPSKQWRQIKEYKKLCEENNLPKLPAYFMMYFTFIELGLLILWFLISK